MILGTSLYEWLNNNKENSGIIVFMKFVWMCQCYFFVTQRTNLIKIQSIKFKLKKKKPKIKFKIFFSISNGCVIRASYELINIRLTINYEAGNIGDRTTAAFCDKACFIINYLEEIRKNSRRSVLRST
jgi:hypothetical protein